VIVATGECRERVLVVGNGMASVRLLESLTRLAPERHAITVVGAEPEPAYNRVLLSALLAEDVTRGDVELKPRAWYAAHGIDLRTGVTVTALDTRTRTAELDSGETLAFDRLILATGSDPIRLPMPGGDLPGVMTFRDLRDIAVMDEAIRKHRSVAVIGGGLLGIEAAYGIAKRGGKVTLVHVMDCLMERQLDPQAAAILKRQLERKGIKVLLKRSTVAVEGSAVAEGLRFADGSLLAADIVIFAVGIRPSIALAKAAGLAVNRGILVDDGMMTDAPGIYAIGECAEHRGTAYGLVEPAYAQAETLARRLAGEPAIFDGMVPSTNLKVSGVPVFSAGDFMGGPGTQSAVLEDRKAGVYRKLVFSGNALTGCVLVGDADDGLWYLDLIRRNADIAAMRRSLLHGRGVAEASLPKAA
jgi:nitrite reductase (NADH) large subunit